MPTKVVQKFTAWSYSRLEMWEGCPLRAKLRHLDKLPEPPAPALARGSAIHKLCENYTLGRMRSLPAELQRFKLEFAALKKIKKKLQVEQQLGLDAGWAPCSWFGPECWCRVVMDCMYDADDTRRVVIDYKTGKINPKHMDQLSLYAIGAYATAPANVKRVDTLLWYLDAGEERGASFLRDDVAELQKAWAKRAAPMLKDVSFKPRPGDACRWCAYSKAKGGPCAF